MSSERQPGAAGGGLARLGRLGRPRGDGVPGLLVEHRFAPAIGQPAAEVPDALAGQLDVRGALDADRRCRRTTDSLVLVASRPSSLNRVLCRVEVSPAV